MPQPLGPRRRYRPPFFRVRLNCRSRGWAWVKAKATSSYRISRSSVSGPPLSPCGAGDGRRNSSMASRVGRAATSWRITSDRAIRGPGKLINHADGHKEISGGECAPQHQQGGTGQDDKIGQVGDERGQQLGEGAQPSLLEHSLHSVVVAGAEAGENLPLDRVLLDDLKARQIVVYQRQVPLHRLDTRPAGSAAAGPQSASADTAAWSAEKVLPGRDANPGRRGRR